MCQMHGEFALAVIVISVFLNNVPQKASPSVKFTAMLIDNLQRNEKHQSALHPYPFVNIEFM